jgi:integrating conjugative element relaxase (TIGR03760 family)
MIELTILAGVAMAALLVWLINRNQSLPTLVAREQQAVIPDGFLPVMTATDLVKRVDGAPLSAAIADKSRATADTFVAVYEPVMARVAEFVQLLPASESHHHAQPGGMLVHTLETALFSLTLRQGVWLPANRGSEQQSMLSHRWTYAVFIAAMIHEVGKAFCDLRITAINAEHKRWQWNPLSGPLAENAAIAYLVEFPASAERNYAAHSRLPMQLLTACVPRSGIQWMSEDAELLPMLQKYLQGEDKQSAFAKLIIEADRESVRRNLLSGSRSRFATARTIPLIEHLMSALRQLLASRAVPLNRAGAAGWVADGHMWLVSKRIADEVRDDLNRRKIAGIPGAEKNDRFFDAWQEYGALVPNPDSGGAIWHVRIELEGWSSPSLTVLKFRLDALFAPGLDRPGDAPGRVVAVNEGDSSPTPSPSIATVKTPMVTMATGAPSREAQFVAEAKAPTMPDIAQPAVATSAVAIAVNAQSRTSTVTEADRRYLSPEDSAGAAAAEVRDLMLPQASVLKPVPVAQPMPMLNSPKIKPASEAAARLMNWLQRGLASGEIAYNVPDALVHFVEEGMLLVSPSVFKRFATLFGESGEGQPAEASIELGKGIQNEVIAAGWHLRSQGKNIVTFEVLSRGAVVSRLNGLLIQNARNFVSPLPPANPHLRRAPEPTKVPTMGKRV